MKIDISVESAIIKTPRVLQLQGIFDCPLSAKLSHHWAGDVPIEARDWNIGLIVGPSGAGKSSIARQMFGEPVALDWKARSVVDDFPKHLGIQEISEACSAVGFNSIPSWAKSFAVLSTGEKFRVELARALLERPDPVMIDEFTSVVDRQVAQIGSNAVQKFIRKRGRKFVAVTCHYDVLDWLQPDWVLEPTSMAFTWREVQRRPSLDVEISRVEYATWKLFAPYHYLTAELSSAAACFGLFVEGKIAAFAGVLHRPHPRVDDVKGVSRVVTLPDYQGMGLAFVLIDAIGSAHAALGHRFRNYPAHPAFIRAHDRSPKWRLIKAPGKFSPRFGSSSAVGAFGGRPGAVFEYAGPRMGVVEARALLDGAAPSGPDLQH